MTIAICDDDGMCLQIAQEQISRWIKERAREDRVVLFNNGDSLLNFLKKEKTDILLLDIMMPMMTGMEVAHIIQKNAMPVRLVFLTSSAEFAVESYDVNASGYLLKPTTYAKFSALLDKLVAVPEENDRISVKTHEGYRSLNIHMIEYTEARGKSVLFGLTDGSSVEGLGTFSTYEEMLTKSKRFFKCHRSYIVNLDRIRSFTASEAYTASGTRCPIARGLGTAFREAFFDNSAIR